MAISDISLTSGMRNNLVSLQQTVNLLDRTQSRLSSGKKVNSALDNPINYFAAQSHLSRATDISNYKDSMAEAIQTIQSANNGITSIKSLIETARGLGQAALNASANSVGFTLTGMASGNIVTVGGVGFSAVNTGASGATQFNVQDADGNNLTVDEIVSNLAAKINSNTESGAQGDIKAVVNGNRITLTSIATDKAITSTTVVTSSGTISVDSKVTAERSTYAAQYETIMTQIDSLAGTGGYKGNNLLTNDTLSVGFEGGSISVKGFNAYVSDMKVNTNGRADYTSSLGTASDNTKWALATNIKVDLNNLDKGVAKLKEESSKLSSALSVINVQQDFSTAKINVLTTGANNLTAADANEEGANMLMLQTRQSLSTTALSLSAQAAQSVLKLFG
jgi:flagellin-like hook-associated protein FlgL